jgi:galactonate dehydratase
MAASEEDQVKIAEITQLHADGGWRTLSFLKIVTACGLVGWSEFSESAATPGLGGVIAAMSARLIGEDPRAINRLCGRLRAATSGTAGGIAAQAVAAIENGCLDIKAKALGVPVYELFGGALRTRLPLYWSHCGTMRLRHAALFAASGAAPVRTLEDIERLGREAAARGYGALKTNILLFNDGAPRNHQPGFGDGDPGRTLDRRMIGGIVDLMSAFRRGGGPAMGLMLDVNFNVRPEAILQLARALEPVGMSWLEMDVLNPAAMAAIRRASPCPVAGLETLYGRAALLPFLSAQSVDVAIIDVQWQGMMEAMRMASLVEAHEVNVASHNYHGHLSTLMGAHFSAAIANFQIMEFEADEPPWLGALMTHPLRIEDGHLLLPDRPGWGSDIDEAALLAHPPRKPRQP